MKFCYWGDKCPAPAFYLHGKSLNLKEKPAHLHRSLREQRMKHGGLSGVEVPPNRAAQKDEKWMWVAPNPPEQRPGDQ